MDFLWSATKASHAVILCCMEQGDIEGWHQVVKIDRVRRAHAQTTLVVRCKISHKKKVPKILPCVYFNKNRCS